MLWSHLRRRTDTVHSAMTAEHAEKIVNQIGAVRPGMGNLTRAVMRRVMQFAVKTEGSAKTPPEVGIEPFKGSGGTPPT